MIYRHLYRFLNDFFKKLSINKYVKLHTTIYRFLNDFYVIDTYIFIGFNIDLCNTI
jgi:hypothetical protein